MGKYRAAYKCPLCGKLIVGELTDVPEEKIPELLGEYAKSQSFFSPFYVKGPLPFVPHKCADGSAGLAPFVGFIKEKRT